MSALILSGHSCSSQFLSIVHDINSAFDCDPTIDVKGVFFDKVWHDGIFFKLEIYGVKGKLFNFISMQFIKK